MIYETNGIVHTIDIPIDEINEMKSENIKIVNVCEKTNDVCASDKDIITRIVKRVVCSNKACGESYNLEFNPSKVEGICGKCGSELIKRADDNEATVRDRLNIYHKDIRIL